MDINKKSISKDWYDLSVNNGEITIGSDNDAVTDMDLSGSSASIITSEDSTIAICTDCQDIISYSGSENHNFRAHLAIYDSGRDTLTLLDFDE